MLAAFPNFEMNSGLESAFGAVLLATMAMISLIIGVVVGLYLKPSQKVTAIIMALGTGALIQALSLELAFEGAERIHESGESGIVAWLWVAGGFLVGGGMYSIGNRLLEQRGASLRHPALTKRYLLKKKREASSELLKRLSQVELLRALPPEEMEDVLVCVEPVSFEPGSTVFRKGDSGDALYLIVSGTVEVLAEDGANGTRTLATLGSGQSFGEMALLTGEPRTATIRAVTASELLRIAKEDFQELLEESPRLRRAIEDLNTQRLAQNVEASKGRLDTDVWQQVAVANIRRLSRQEEEAMLRKHAASGAPLAIFLGALMDGIPESVVIGSNFVSLESFRFTFLAAVFLSNLPEAIASAVGMKSAGFSTKKIFGLWSLLVGAGAVASAAGNVFLAGASPVVLTFVGAIAGGGILAMVSSVMMPEAYEDGGPTVGLATIIGFLAAFLFTFL